MKPESIVILQAPTPPSAIKYLPRGIDKQAKTAMAIPYISARFIQQRLDEAFGPLGWQTDIKEIRGFVCVGIGVKADSAEWVWRWDTGQEDQNEASGETADGEADEDDSHGGAKAIVSRGLKRCGVQLGIGRDIYDMKKKRYKINLDGRGKWSGWAEDVTLDPKPTPQPTTAPKADGRATAAGKSESVLFADFARDKGATQEQIAKAISDSTLEGAKTDWLGARNALAKALDEAPF